MLTFTLTMSCLTIFNLPWFMDLTFQVPMQYCSLQHWTLLLSPVTSTTGCCFCFGSNSAFFLDLFPHWSPVAYWAPTDLGSSSFSVISLCLFILFMGFSRQEYWSGLPFPSPVDHILSELSTMNCPSWVTLHGIAHTFIELDKAVVHVIRLASFLWLWFQSVCPLMEKDKRLMEAPWWERLTEGETGSYSYGWGHQRCSVISINSLSFSERTAICENKCVHVFWVICECVWVDSEHGLVGPAPGKEGNKAHWHPCPRGTSGLSPWIGAEGRAWEEGQLLELRWHKCLQCPQMTFMLPKHLIWRSNRLSDMWTPKLMLCYLGDTDWNSAQGSQGPPAERSARNTLETVVHQLHDDGVTRKHGRGIPQMKSIMATHLKRTLSYQERQCRRHKHTSSGPEFP